MNGLVMIMRKMKMPTYTLRDKKTGKETELFMSISEMEQYEKDHPEIEVACGAPRLGYHINRMKPSEDFRDRLREMKKHHPGNTINIT